LVIYRDAESSVYQLTFEDDKVYWVCLEGPFLGESGVARYRAVALDDETLLIAWAEQSGETAMLVARIDGNSTYVCYAYNGECTIVPASVSRSAPPGSVAGRPLIKE
jgi:hypothetical protein